MLTLIGDILNWAAAGIVFPLMLLPLAGLAGRRSVLAGSAIWLALVVGVGGGGLAFTVLAPRMAPGEFLEKLPIFGALIIALAATIFAAGGPREATRRLAGVAGPLTRGAGRLVMWLVLAMALVQFAVVILRYVFGLNFIFMQEGVTYMHGAVFLLAAGYALLTDDHVRVDIFYRGASPRKKALIDFIGTYVLLFPICLLILWTGAGYVGNSWAVGEGSAEQSGIQGVFLLKSLIPAFAMLLAMAGFVMAARAGALLRGEAP